MGLANLIPGISGGTLAITLGIYEDFIGALSNFFGKLKENIMFLLPIGIGMVLSILSLSNVIDYGLNNYIFATIMLFIGAILGGLPMLCKRMQGEKITSLHGIIFVVAFMLVVVTVFLAGDNEISFENLNILDYLQIFVVGIISAGTMIIPGISGSAVLMTIGYYSPIINAVKNLTNIDKILTSVMSLVPFGLGILVGMLGGAKLIEFVIKKYPIKAYFGIVGFVIASIIGIFYQNFFIDGVFIYVSMIELFIGIVLCLLAMTLTFKLSNIDNSNVVENINVEIASDEILEIEEIDEIEVEVEVEETLE